ncbi:MAG: hypothetical protein NT096_10700 [Proteobacteria bacterium]|nr:hypothetical protein [Pseudomonadota bacterium]
MDKNNSFVRMEREVLDSEIDFSNGVYFYIRVPRVSRENLICLVQFCEKADRYFKGKNIEVGIASLSTAIDYARDDLGKFISRKELNDPSFDIDAWHQRICARREVNKKLIGRIEGEYDYYIVSIFPPEGFDEFEMFRLVQSWLKNRDLSWWELYFDPDLQIDPSFQKVEIDGRVRWVDMQIDPIGWSIGRGVIDAVSNCDFFKKLIPAIVAISFFILLVKVGSFRQALIGSLVVSIGTLFVRGTIGIGQHVFSLFSREEAYTLLVYIVSLIPGFSFSMRRFEEFNDTGHTLDYWERWREADKNGFPSMNLIAFISILDFLIFMTWQNRYGSRSMFQIGIFSSVGLFYAWWLARYFLPALHRVIGGEKRSPLRDRGLFNRIYDYIFIFFNQGFDKVSRITLQISSKPKIPLVACGLLFFCVFLSALFINLGFLRIDTDYGTFLHGTKFGLVKEELEKKGRPGFCLYEIYVAPKEGSDLNDPEFVSQLWQYAKVIEKKSRTVFGPIDYFVSIFERDYREEFNKHGLLYGALSAAANINSGGQTEPYTISNPDKRTAMRDIVSGVWNDIRDNSDHAVMKHFLSKNAVMMAATDSDNTAMGYLRFSGMLLEEGKPFDRLSVKIASKNTQAGYANKIIADGTVMNSIYSQIMIAVICMIWLEIHNRKRKGVWKLCPYRTGVIMAVPFIFSTANVFLLMMAMDIPLDAASATIGNISISVAVDLPIFFIAVFQQLIISGEDFSSALGHEKMQNEGSKILADFAINTPAFIPLLFSAFLSIAYVGFLMVMVMISCTIGTLFLMPPMLRWAVVRVK